MTNEFNFIDTPRDNGTFEFYTLEGTQSFKSIQCKHCGIHWQYIRNSGKQRGWCMKCNGMLCGKEECVKECFPYEAQIEFQEGKQKTILQYKDTIVGRRFLAEAERLKRQYDPDTAKSKGGIILP